MRDRYRAPKLAALSLAGTVGLAACSGGGVESQSQSNTPSAGPTTTQVIGSDILPKDLSTCTGKLDGLNLRRGADVKLGAHYEVTNIVGGAACASVYDYSSLKGYGGLAKGDDFLLLCMQSDKPGRAYVIAPNTSGNAWGDVNLTENGLAQIQQEQQRVGVPNCDTVPVPDIGKFEPHPTR